MDAFKDFYNCLKISTELHKIDEVTIKSNYKGVLGKNPHTWREEVMLKMVTKFIESFVTSDSPDIHSYFDYYTVE